MTGALKGALVTANLTSDNALLKMTTDAEYNLAHRYPDGKVTVDVTQLDLHELGLMPQPMKRPLAFNLSAEARQNRVFTHLTSGDMKLNLSARSGVNPLISQSTHFMDVLMKQIDEKALNHVRKDCYIMDVSSKPGGVDFLRRKRESVSLFSGY